MLFKSIVFLSQVVVDYFVQSAWLCMDKLDVCCHNCPLVDKLHNVCFSHFFNFSFSFIGLYTGNGWCHLMFWTQPALVGYRWSNTVKTGGFKELTLGLRSAFLAVDVLYQSHNLSHTASVSLRDCGQHALQQLLATEPRYSLLFWEWRGETAGYCLSNIPDRHISLLEGRHHQRACGGHPALSQ